MRHSSEPTECLGTLVRTHALVTTRIARRLRRHGVSPAAFNALLLLRRARRPLPPHEIGEALAVTRGAVTGLLDSLETRGLVVRVPHPQDRRMLLVELTSEGQQVVRRLVREQQTSERELLGCLAAEERALLIGILSKLQEHLEDTA